MRDLFSIFLPFSVPFQNRRTNLAPSNIRINRRSMASRLAPSSAALGHITLASTSEAGSTAVRRCVVSRISTSWNRRILPVTSSSMKAIFPSFSIRKFHSQDHPLPPGPFKATEAKLLEAAYKHVPEHGFTTAALTLGACDIGFPYISTSVLQNGEFDLIRWHLDKQKKFLAGAAAELVMNDGQGLSIPEKVEQLIWVRLMGNKDLIGHWQKV